MVNKQLSSIFSVPRVLGLSVHPTCCSSVVLEEFDVTWPVALTVTTVVVRRRNPRRIMLYMIPEFVGSILIATEGSNRTVVP